MPYEVKPGGRELVAKQGLRSDFRSAALRPKQVIFRSDDGLTLHGQFFLPRDAKGKIPGLVFMQASRSGIWCWSFHYMDYYHNA